MPAPAWATSAATNGSGAAVNATVPAGVAPGDILTAVIALFGITSTTTITPPDSSWTQKTSIYNAVSIFETFIFWKRATAADTGTYNFTFGATPSLSAADIMRYTGAIQSGDPFDAVTMAITSGVITGPLPAVQLSTSGPNRLLVWGAFQSQAQAALMTPPAGYSGVEWSGSRSRINDTTQALAGATGPVTGSSSFATGGGDGYTTLLYALRPPDSSGFFDFL